jgi:hypothetical protein
MVFESLLHEIDAEINRLQQAKALLSGTNRHRRPGRPAKAAAQAKTATPGKPATPVEASRPKRVLSAQARKRIGDALRARWAKVKAEKAKAAKK